LTKIHELKPFLIPCVAAILGVLLVAVSYFIPVSRYYFGGSGAVVYGFPFEFREYWSLDLIGSGSFCHPFTILQDYIFWFVISAVVLSVSEILKIRMTWYAQGQV
jgi:hypothetical protein